MKPKNLETELRNLLDFLMNNDLAVDANPVDVRAVYPATRITWKSPNPALMTGGEFATLDNYFSIASAKAYSAFLYDGGILQISYDFKRNDVVGHRLAFYPCPFEVDEDAFVFTPILDVLDQYRLNGEKYLRLRSPLRFDFDQKGAKTGHPTVHLHVIRQRCRCAVVAPLSLGHFIRFVFYHFYPFSWQAHEYLREYPQVLGKRTITVPEETHLHLGCSR